MAAAATKEASLDRLNLRTYSASDPIVSTPPIMSAIQTMVFFLAIPVLCAKSAESSLPNDETSTVGTILSLAASIFAVLASCANFIDSAMSIRCRLALAKVSGG